MRIGALHEAVMNSCGSQQDRFLTDGRLGVTPKARVSQQAEGLRASGVGSAFGIGRPCLPPGVLRLTSGT